MVVAFFTERRDFKHHSTRWGDDLPRGRPGVAWPKRSSGRTTTMDENVVRAVVLPLGFVANKVCAIDETWLGSAWSRDTSDGDVWCGATSDGDAQEKCLGETPCPPRSGSGAGRRSPSPRPLPHDLVRAPCSLPPTGTGCRYSTFRETVGTEGVSIDRRHQGRSVDSWMTVRDDTPWTLPKGFAISRCPGHLSSPILRRRQELPSTWTLGMRQLGCSLAPQSVGVTTRICLLRALNAHSSLGQRSDRSRSWWRHVARRS